MDIIKRDGTRVPLSMDRVHKRIKDQSNGLSVNHLKIAMEVIQQLFDGVTSTEIDEQAARIAAQYTLEHHDYSVLAARLQISRMQKQIPETFEASFKAMKDAGMLNKDYIKQVQLYSFEEIESAIKYNRDFQFNYFGYKTFERTYMAELKNGTKLERPQHTYMRTAITVTTSIADAIRVYDLISKHYYTHATPTQSNSGLTNQQLASCFLINNFGDDTDLIMDTLKDAAKISAKGGGIGLSINNLRAKGTLIKGNGGESDGWLPVLRTGNELQKWWKQNGSKRKGSWAFYAEPWHKDIRTFLDIRKATGKEEFRARDIFTAIWMNDIFMSRVEADEHWTLFCPHEVFLATGKYLWDIHNEEFKAVYEQAEAIPGLGEKIKARDLWIKIMEAQIETGTPYIVYKDVVNRTSNQKNLGTIKSSNLCAEIVEFTDDQEIAVCNLASIALSKYVKRHKEGHMFFDFEDMMSVAKVVVRACNVVIDKTHYPVARTKKSNNRHRPIAIGVQGLADAFAMMGFAFDSPEAKQLNKDIFEALYYASVSESNELARLEGAYETIEGSPISQGIFNFEMYGVNAADLKYSWESLRDKVKKYGVRNSLLIGLMPTATTSQVMDNNECFEPFTSNMYTRTVLGGNFNVINKHLMRDLEERNLWTKSVRNEIIRNKGSVQSITAIPQEIRDRYKTANEISQAVIIDLAADRQPFVDQSQSMNIFMGEPTIGKLNTMHFRGWKSGLKTGMYYLRGKAAASANANLGGDFSKKQEAPKASAEESLSCSLDNPEACEACGS